MNLSKLQNNINFGTIQKQNRDVIISKLTLTKGLEEKQIKTFDEAKNVILKYDSKTGMVYAETTEEEKNLDKEEFPIFDEASTNQIYWLATPPKERSKAFMELQRVGMENQYNIENRPKSLPDDYSGPHFYSDFY